MSSMILPHRLIPEHLQLKLDPFYKTFYSRNLQIIVSKTLQQYLNDFTYEDFTYNDNTYITLYRWHYL